jgi:hypothetical protein
MSMTPPFDIYDETDSNAIVCTPDPVE